MLTTVHFVSPTLLVFNIVLCCSSVLAVFICQVYYRFSFVSPIPPPWHGVALHVSWLIMLPYLVYPCWPCFVAAGVTNKSCFGMCWMCDRQILYCQMFQAPCSPEMVQIDACFGCRHGRPHGHSRPHGRPHGRPRCHQRALP